MAKVKLNTKRMRRAKRKERKKQDAPSYPFRATALHFSEPGHPNTLREDSKIKRPNT
jgi:hypothetical protein